MNKRFSKAPKWLIAGVITIILACMIGAGIFFFGNLYRAQNPEVPTESFIEWVDQFEAVPNLENAELTSQGYDRGWLGQGNETRASFGYYWLLKTDLSETELMAYYQAYVDKANEETIGIETILEVQLIENTETYPLLYELDPLNDALDELTDREIEESQYYVVYAYKCGRWEDIN